MEMVYIIEEDFKVQTCFYLYCIKYRIHQIVSILNTQMTKE